MKKFLLLILFVFVFTGSYSQVFTVDTIYYHGNTDNRINLVILGDGYLSSELPQFRLDAQSVADYFFSIEPFATYKNFFNFFAVEVVSNESGVNHPGTATDELGVTQPITVVDNFLETTFDHGGTHRCVYSNNQGIVFSVVNANVPYYDFVNVIINTSYYGGCAGGVAYTTMNSSSPEIFTHEFGHMFGSLADEYDYGGSSCSAGTTQRPNVSQQTDTSLLIWKRWLTNAPIPTPAGIDCNKIGLYQGAQYCDSNWYRPKCDCKMRSLGQPYCEVCYEQFIFSISNKVNYIENHSPAIAVVNVCQGDSQLFNVDILNTSDSTIRVQWKLDSVLVANHTFNYTFDASLYSPGLHQLKAYAYDTTLHAKKPLMMYNQSWNIYILDASVATSDSSHFCEGDSAILKATRGATYTYQWLLNDQVIPGENDSIITVRDSGDYSVVISTGICSDTSNTLSVIENPLPVVSFSGLLDTICITIAPFTLSGNPSGGDFISTGMIGDLFDPLLAGPGLNTVSYEYSDTNGCAGVSSKDVFVDLCLGIKTIDGENFVSIYPNPSSGKIILENNSKESNNLSILIYDMMGKFQQKLLSDEVIPVGKKLEVDCSDLSPGTYFLQITFGNQTYLDRFVIIK